MKMKMRPFIAVRARQMPPERVDITNQCHAYALQISAMRMHYKSVPCVCITNQCCMPVTECSMPMNGDGAGSSVLKKPRRFNDTLSFRR